MINSAKSLKGNIKKFEDDYNPALHPDEYNTDSSPNAGRKIEIERKTGTNNWFDELYDKFRNTNTGKQIREGMQNYSDYITEYYKNHPNGVLTKIGDIGTIIGRGFGLYDYDQWKESAERLGVDLPTIKEHISNITGNKYSATQSGSAGSSGSKSINNGMNVDEIFNLMKEWRDDDRAWNAEQAQKQMDFQERMARNAHTYEMEDLKNAGLNPVLAAGASSGASASNGAAASSNSDVSTIAQVAMMALETAQVTSAIGAVNQKKGLLGFLSDKNVMNAIGTVGKIASIASTAMHIFGA